MIKKLSALTFVLSFPISGLSQPYAHSNNGVGFAIIGSGFEHFAKAAFYSTLTYFMYLVIKEKIKNQENETRKKRTKAAKKRKDAIEKEINKDQIAEPAKS